MDELMPDKLLQQSKRIGRAKRTVPLRQGLHMKCTMLTTTMLTTNGLAHLNGLNAELISVSVALIMLLANRISGRQVVQNRLARRYYQALGMGNKGEALTLGRAYYTFRANGTLTREDEQRLEQEINESFSYS